MSDTKAIPLNCNKLKILQENQKNQGHCSACFSYKPQIHHHFYTLNPEESVFDEFKNKFRMDINRSLLAIAFTLFGLWSPKACYPLKYPTDRHPATIAVPLSSQALLAGQIARPEQEDMGEYCFVTFPSYASHQCMGILLTLVIGLQLASFFFAVISCLYHLLFRDL